jgi:hypothetical protein
MKQAVRCILLFAFILFPIHVGLAQMVQLGILFCRFTFEQTRDFSLDIGLKIKFKLLTCER